jgi:hypothetical protein
MTTEPLLSRVEDQVLLSLKAAKAAATEASQLIASNPEIDGSGLASAIGRFLESQAELIAAVQSLAPVEITLPPTSSSDETLMTELPDDWGEPRDWLEPTRGRRRARR